MSNPRTADFSAVGISKRFGTRWAVRDVSASVRRGEVVGLVGPNGAGKTTCFYLMSGLVAPDAGAIFLDGKDVTSLEMFERARLGVGYLPQESSIFRGMTVEQNITCVAERVEPNKAQCNHFVDELLAEFSLQHLRRAPARALSGGERRRVEVARALASRPSVVLLDEPFAGIDRPCDIGHSRPGPTP